jgi:hypothetical protein
MTKMPTDYYWLILSDSAVFPVIETMSVDETKQRKDNI